MSEDVERRRAMVIVAHPDDAEFTAGGTVARWAEEGVEVGYLVCTNGNKGSGDPQMTSDRLIQLRRQEQRQAAEVLGVAEVFFLDHDDGYLEPTLELRREITSHIRRYRPDTVIAPDPTRRWWGRSYINHPDHIAVGEAALAAIFPSARDHLTFPQLLEQGLEPHKVREILLADRQEPDVYVDITPYLDKKIRALECHVSQTLGDIRGRLAERAEELVRLVLASGASPLDGHQPDGTPEAVEAYKRFLLD